jgi:MoxR-like ATPase
MTPNQVAAEIHVILNAGLAPYIHGPTGIGKSRVVKDYSGEHDLELRDIRASQLDPVDARGIPVAIPERGVTSWYPPDFLPRSGRGIIFLDELNRANQDTQSALYQLILERRIGDYVLPEGWSIIAAGNRDVDGCMVQPMSRALKNRFIHLTMEANYEDWHQWAHKNHIAEQIIAFMKFRPSALDEMEEATRDASGKHLDRIRNANSFATPRSWEFASDLLKEAIKQGRKIRDCFYLLEGAVGEGMAGELTAYCDIYSELPDLERLIAHPDEYVPTKTPNKLYAICTGLAARVTEKNFGNVKKILDQMEPEYSVWTIKDCLQRNKAIAKHPEYGKWVIKNIEYAA